MHDRRIVCGSSPVHFRLRPGHHTAAGFAGFWDSGVPNWFMRRSWGHLGCIKATIGHSIRKRCRGITHFREAFGPPLGPWATPKPPQPLPASHRRKINRKPVQKPFDEHHRGDSDLSECAGNPAPLMQYPTRLQQDTSTDLRSSST